ncbi:MAG: helix-turn-helix transcriptional regulator [Polyangiaceae bacterium]
MRTDDISIVEAAYTLSEDPLVWLENVLARSEPRLFDGLGGFASIYRRDAGTPSEMVSPYVVRGADTRITDALRVAFEATDDATRRLAFTIGRPIATLTDLHGVAPKDHPHYAGLVEAVGFGDVVTVNASNPDGTGCFLSAPLRRSRRDPTATRWARLAAHVAAGLRLQLSLGDANLESASEAVLSPTGEFLHANERTARVRKLLSRIVRGIDQARAGRKRRDSDSALDAWTALTLGRWSLVDAIESDGQRLVLALPNEPWALDPRALTLEERTIAAYVARGHSNKLIAYTLGLPAGTVATRTRIVLRKLGVRTRAEFVHRYLTLMAAVYEEASVDGAPIILGQTRTTDTKRPPLTKAELAVATLAVRGHSNASIARARRVSPRTVANQLRRVYEVYGVSSRAELALAFGS